MRVYSYIYARSSNAPPLFPLPHHRITPDLVTCAPLPPNHTATAQPIAPLPTTAAFQDNYILSLYPLSYIQLTLQVVIASCNW